MHSFTEATEVEVIFFFFYLGKENSKVGWIKGEGAGFLLLREEEKGEKKTSEKEVFRINSSEQRSLTQKKLSVTLTESWDGEGGLQVEVFSKMVVGGALGPLY